MKLIVNTTPKSGTYLLAEYLKAMGFIWDGFHVHRHGREHMWMKTEAEMKKWRNTPRRVQIPVEWEGLEGRLPEEGFTIGHFETDRYPHFRNMKIIQATRHPREGLHSYMSFLKRTGNPWRIEQIGAGYLSHTRRMFYTPDQPNLIKVSFERIRQGDIQMLEVALRRNLSDAEKAQVLATETLTKGYVGDKIEWTPAYEKWFEKHRGPHLVREMGYDK